MNELNETQLGYLQGAAVEDKDGWRQVRICGKPFHRGFQHGYLLAADLDACLRSNRFWAKWLTAQDFDYFVKAAEEMYLPFIDDEYREEMQGIADGARAGGVDTTFNEILAWNSFVDLVYSWWPGHKSKVRPAQPARHRDVGHRCSAFIATGDVTGGKIVMAHNTWDAFLQAQHFNVVMEIVPETGHRIVMQTAPGWIASMMDFTITSAGLMVTETTIDGYYGFDASEVPEFYRSRRASQYAASIEDWAEIMTLDRNGGYANSWLLGDANTGEIARYELGLKYVGPLERTRNGVFYGENIARDLTVRVMETQDPSAYSDISGSGARRVRWKKLMKEHDGRIDREVAQRLIADHWDEYLLQDVASSRTLCGHVDQDDGRAASAHGHPPFYPWGAVDGKVADTESALSMSFHGRWGRACGEPFMAAEFIEAHPQYDWLEGYLMDRPGQPWSRLAPGDARGS